MVQLVKTNEGIKVRTDHGEEIVADVVLFATGNLQQLPVNMCGVLMFRLTA